MRFRFLPVWSLTLPLLLGGLVIASGAETTARPQPVSGDEKPASGSQKSVTVFPVAIVPSKNIPVGLPKRFAAVVGSLLERAGVDEVEVAEKAFTPPETDDLSKVAEAFGDLVAGQSIETEYALYGEILHADRKIQAIRTILVDKQGKAVLADQDDQETFARTSHIQPKDPMTCLVFLAVKLQKLWGLADPLRKDAPSGKLEERLRKEAGVPSDRERAAMANRLQALKAKLDTAKLTVHPVRVGRESDKACSVQLVNMLNDQGVCSSQVGQDGPKLQIRGSFDQQKVLWDTARAFRQFVRESRPDTEYTLFADYGIFSPASDRAKVNHVHFIVCDRAGDWVIVDYQNSHHADFQRISPKSPQDCNRLLVERLKSYVSPD